jgi:hypothetical protein
MRSGARVAIVLGMTALPWLSHAQAPVVTRGVLGSSQSTQSGNATTGVLRGAVPPGATVGAGRGAVPPDASIGVVRSGPSSNETMGTLRGPTAPTEVGTFLPPDAPVGTFAAPMPPGTRFGEPGPADIAQRLAEQARRSLVDHDFAAGEALLNRSVRVREESVGRDHPDVAKALEDNAALLRRYNREAAAADMDARAREIRTRLEPPPRPTPPEGGAPPQ